MEMDERDYNLVDVEKEIAKKPITIGSKKNKLNIILLALVIFLILVIATLIILYFTVLKKNGEEKKEGDSKDEEKKEEFFYVFTNIKTSENNKIINSFGEKGKNYIEEIGNINNGNDYNSTDRDNLDLCIPYGVMENKTNYTTILLDIHGGGWIAGYKNDAKELCKDEIYKNFIVATMSYTLLNGQYKEYHLFRIIDEIHAALTTLKYFLTKIGFDENKLEVVIKGESAGSHLSLLYSYMIKDPPIPIKMIINNVGPITLNPDYLLQTKPNADPLDNITQTDIDNALNKSLLIPMNGSATGVLMNNTMGMMFINALFGKPFFDSFNEIFSNIATGELNKNSSKYKELMTKVKYFEPTTYVTEESIPTLCLYGGKDFMLGVYQYALLKKAFEKCNNNNISLVYFKYGTHLIFDNSTGEYGKKVNETYKEEIYRYYKSYLDSYKKNNYV